MAKIEVLTTFVTKVKNKERSYPPGSVLEVEDAEAARLVERGLARAIEADEAAARAKAEADAVAKAKADEEARAQALAKAEEEERLRLEAEAEKAAAEAKAAADAAPGGNQLALGGSDAPGA